jgi:hypothetical protein
MVCHPCFLRNPGIAVLHHGLRCRIYTCGVYRPRRACLRSRAWYQPALPRPPFRKAITTRCTYRGNTPNLPVFLALSTGYRTRQC